MKNKYVIGYYNPANLVTISGAMCAVLACFMTARGHYCLAMAALSVAALCDALDGRIARATLTTGTRARFYGVQMDSLCDLVSFGVAPCFIAYLMGYDHTVDTLLYLLFIICGAIRLANFNTEATMDTPDLKMKYFTGVPIPFSASVMPLLVIVHLLVGSPVFWLSRILFLAIGAGYILRFKIPKPSGKVQMFFGVYAVICLIILAIIANVKK